MLDDADTDDCQARVPALAKRARTPSLAGLNNRLGKDTRALGANLLPTGDRAKAAPNRHETGMMTQAEQQLLRRAAVECA